MDLCRQSIVFEDLAGVAACLAAVRADKEVRVLRVKNRLDPDYDAAASAGYRDVALNLQLVSAQAGQLRVDLHVCEVQLLLLPFAQLKVRPDNAPEACRLGLGRALLLAAGLLHMLQTRKMRETTGEGYQIAHAC